MKRRVCMILDGTFPPDIRVEKEAMSLIAAGYHVTLLCRAEPGAEAAGVFQSIAVVRVAVQSPNRYLQKLQQYMTEATFHSRAWHRRLREHVGKRPPDLVHVHDLPLVNTALAVAAPLRIPVIADLHENYAEAVREHLGLFTGVRAAANRLVKGRDRWLRHEGAMCRRVDQVIAVVDEMKQRLMRQHGLAGSRISVVTNTERRDFVERAVLDAAIVDGFRDRFLLLYIGSYGPHRGLETAIEGLALLRDEIPGLCLAIVGQGHVRFDRALSALIEARGVSDLVIRRGWQEFDKVFSYMHAASVGLVPHHRNEQTDHTIPHKLFQLMMTGTPVLVSSCRPLARVVRETGAGLVFEASNPGDFARRTRQLYRDEEACRRMAENGKNACLRGGWYWEASGEKLVELYDSLLGAGRLRR